MKETSLLNKRLRVMPLGAVPFLVMGLYIGIWSIVISDLSLLFTYVLFAGLSVIVPADVSKGRSILHFSVYTILGLLYYSYYIHISGKPFIGGGDDEIFWIFANEFAAADFSFDIQFSNKFFFLAIEFKAYVYLLALYVKFLNLLGLESGHAFHLVLFNVFIATLSAGLMFRLCLKLYPKVRPNYFFLVTLFPIIIFHNVTLLRESWIMFFFLLLIAIIQGKKTYSKLVFVPLILAVVFFFRVAHGGLFVVFLMTYFFFSLKNSKPKALLLLVSFLGFVIFWSSGGMQYVEIINRTSEFYMEQSNENSSASSLGNVFYSSNNPVFLIMRPLMLLFSPLPPPVLVQMRLDSLFFSIGSLIWYYLNGLNILALFSSSNKGHKENFSPLQKALLVTVIVSLILVSFTSRDPRHLVYIYPLILAQGIHNYLSHKDLRKSFPLLAIVAFLGLVSLYILLKAFA